MRVLLRITFWLRWRKYYLTGFDLIDVGHDFRSKGIGSRVIFTTQLA